ncbi:MAG TPA: polyphosphate polymerase domain-containing protein [Bacteroidia bacterium]|nr:polyphosphate polymerase domain-containing protein [Bacteroidia bacterium]
MPDDVSHMLLEFEALSLKQLDSVKLLNRQDTKYLFNRARLPDILEHLQKDYAILDIKGRRLNSYRTLYFDTSDFSLYRKHHNGNLNRLKVRQRIYSDTGLLYLEVKFKNNKGRTMKERLKLNSLSWPFGQSEIEFLSTLTGLDPAALQPQVWVNYQRLTLSGKQGPERVTLDINLEIERDHRTHKWPGLVIAEVKQDKKTFSAFSELMRRKHIQGDSLSKYCMAMASTNSNLKQNHFKEKLNLLKQYQHHEHFASHH